MENLDSQNYLAPFDLYGGEIKKGDLIFKTSHFRHMYSNIPDVLRNYGSISGKGRYYFPHEIVEKYFLKMDSIQHTIYKKGDLNIPESILDENGDIVLSLCKDCGKAEADLREPCVKNKKIMKIEDVKPGEAIGGFKDVNELEIFLTMLENRKMLIVPKIYYLDGINIKCLINGKNTFEKMFDKKKGLFYFHLSPEKRLTYYASEFINNKNEKMDHKNDASIYLKTAHYTAEKINEDTEAYKKKILHSSNNTHTLKCQNPFFSDAILGLKDFEVRKNDRNFNIGDLLVLVEWPVQNEGLRSVTKKIKYILKGGKFGIDENYVVLGLKDVE